MAHCLICCKHPTVCLGGAETISCKSRPPNQRLCDPCSHMLTRLNIRISTFLLSLFTRTRLISIQWDRNFCKSSHCLSCESAAFNAFGPPGRPCMKYRNAMFCGLQVQWGREIDQASRLTSRLFSEHVNPDISRKTFENRTARIYLAFSSRFCCRLQQLCFTN